MNTLESSYLQVHSPLESQYQLFLCGCFDVHVNPMGLDTRQSCEEQALLELLQPAACQVSSSSLFLPSNMAWFPGSLIPKEQSHYFKMPDHYQSVRIMNQAIPELADKAP